jgi:raffinose/stachyose/melibiose transport system permease protein
MTLPIEKQIKNKAKTKKILKQGLIHLILIIAVCVLLYPVACTVFVSLKSTKEALLSPNTFPTEFHFENFVEAWNVMNYPRVFLNTVLVTAGGLVGVVFISSAAAYTIAWSKHIKLYTFFYVFFLCGIMIPFHTSLVPLVNLMADIKFNDSIWGLIVFYWGRNIPMSVFLFVGFIRGISREIPEAAKIDGANLFQIYLKILFPMMKPITSTIIVLDALAFWNDFLFPRLMLVASDNRTIALAQYYFKGEYSTQYNIAFAGYVLAALPVLILYFFMQKYIVKGIAAGAVKG